MKQKKTKMNLNQKQKISETLYRETELLKKYLASFRLLTYNVTNLFHKNLWTKKNFF